MSREPTRPSRPHIPLALYALAVVLCVERAVMGEGLGLPSLVVPMAGVALIGACAAAAFALGGRGEVAFALVALLVACEAALFSAGAAARGVGSCAGALSESSISTWEFRVSSDMTRGSSLWRGRAEAVGPNGERGSVWLQWSDEISQGTTVRGIGRFSENGDDEWGRSSRAQGVCGTVRLVRLADETAPTGALGMLLGAREAALEAFETDGWNAGPRAILAGSVCGSTAAMRESGLDDLFATCGASHLVAVSGGHLVLVSALLSSLLGHVGRPRGLRSVLTVGATLLFVVFCGSPASAVRSWVMSCVAVAGSSAGRRGHQLSSVGVTGIVLSLFDPCVTGQLGFMLSVVCVAAIGLFGTYARYACTVVFGAPKAPKWMPRRLRMAFNEAVSSGLDALSLTIVCQLASLPLAAPTFGQVSLVAPLANAALALLFTPLVGLGVVAAILVRVSWLQAILLAFADVTGTCVIGLLRVFASFPLASIAVGDDAAPWALACGALAIALLIWWPRLNRGALVGAFAAVLCVAAAFLARWRLLAPARVCVLDVGQADAILVTDGSASLMVDSGVDSEVVAALGRNHVTHLDGVVLTHLDDDHVGGLEDLVGTVDVGCVYVARGVAASMGEELGQTIRVLTGTAPVELSYGDVVSIGDFSARVVWPTEAVDGDENADSLALYLSYEKGGKSLTALLTGDCEREETSAIVAAGDVGDIDFLKVGHHGSKESVDRDVATALRPEVSVASAGEGNSYGHPRTECVEALESAGSLFLCTKDVGDVYVAPGVAGPAVSAQKGGTAITGTL